MAAIAMLFSSQCSSTDDEETSSNDRRKSDRESGESEILTSVRVCVGAINLNGESSDGYFKKHTFWTIGTTNGH